jgi:hypothetical protein
MISPGLRATFAVSLSLWLPADLLGSPAPDLTATELQKAIAVVHPVPCAAPEGRTGWRSKLFPEGWHEGTGLHDFSYAGYRNGEALLPSPPVLVRLAPTSGDSGPAIQEALDRVSANGGGVVLLSQGHYRVDGVLTIKGSRVILRGQGAGLTRLHFTRHENMTGRSHLTVRGSPRIVRESVLVGDARPFGRAVTLSDSQGFAKGDHVELGCKISEAFVAEHGMSGVWKPFNGTWQPFFRRTVVAVEGNRVVLDVPTRYVLKVRDGASLRKIEGLSLHVGVENLGLSNAGSHEDAWANDRVHVLEFRAVSDAWVRDVHSFASRPVPQEGRGTAPHLASGGILVRDSKRVTVAQCRMANAQHRGGGGNGYLFEVRQSGEVLFRDCHARAGRHNFIQNWGFGVSGCVWLRCTSRGGRATNKAFGISVGSVGLSEYHHSLAMANLVDSCFVDDGWAAVNRRHYSSGAGHTATECVFWNVTGPGTVRSDQFARGYVIGTGRETKVRVRGDDWLEGEGKAGTLSPSSLYEAQFEMRTGRVPHR